VSKLRPFLQTCDECPNTPRLPPSIGSFPGHHASLGANDKTQVVENAGTSARRDRLAVPGMCRPPGTYQSISSANNSPIPSKFPGQRDVVINVFTIAPASLLSALLPCHVVFFRVVQIVVSVGDFLPGPTGRTKRRADFRHREARQQKVSPGVGAQEFAPARRTSRSWV